MSKPPENRLLVGATYSSLLMPNIGIFRLFFKDTAFQKAPKDSRKRPSTGSYINLDYPYTFLSGPGGEDPVDLEAFNQSKARYEAVVTDAETGEAVYYGKKELAQGDFDVIKGSCCVMAFLLCDKRA